MPDRPAEIPKNAAVVTRTRWLALARVWAAVGVALVIALQVPQLSWTLRFGMRMDSGKAMQTTSWNTAMVLLDVVAIVLVLALPSSRTRLLCWLPVLLLVGSALALPLGQFLRPLIRLLI